MFVAQQWFFSVCRGQINEHHAFFKTLSFKKTIDFMKGIQLSSNIFKVFSCWVAELFTVLRVVITYVIFYFCIIYQLQNDYVNAFQSLTVFWFFSHLFPAASSTLPPGSITSGGIWEDKRLYFRSSHCLLRWTVNS